MLQRLSLSEDLALSQSIDTAIAALDRLPNTLDHNGFALMTELASLLNYRANAIVHDDRGACRQWLWQWDSAGLAVRPIRIRNASLR